MSRVVPIFVALLALAAPALRGQERGVPIFSDSFATAATFAENWHPDNRAIHAADGAVIFPRGGTLTMRTDTPREFYAEMDISLDMSIHADTGNWANAFCGFRVEGFHFLVLPVGRTWMIYRLAGQERNHGKQVAIPGFALDTPVHLVLVRKVANDVATYTFTANGQGAGTFVVAAPEPAADGGPDAFKPLEIFSYNVRMTLDNFSLSTVRHSADDSPNVIINSSFEHAVDGYPLYFPRSGFNLAKASTIRYEDFLATWSLDTGEKHSGNQSLKMVLDDSVTGQRLWAWGAGTVKDSAGVFSLWLKADREDFPVQLYYGKTREVTVGTNWQRHEVVNPKLPGVGVYSPVCIFFRKTPGTLWVDDLQAEFLGDLDTEVLDADGTYATPYKPSELDKQRFGERAALSRAPTVTIPRLPAGVAPSADLDGWGEHAACLDRFHFRDQPPRNRTLAYLACDADTLYLGYRCFGADLAAAAGEPAAHDSFGVFSGDSVEFFLAPAADGRFFQFAVDAAGTRVDIGPGGDVAWNGAWQATVRANAAAGSVDYFIAVPLATVAAAAMGPRWLVNICRNDRVAKEHVAVTCTPLLGFKQTASWPDAQLPPAVVGRYAVGVTAAGAAADGDGTAIALTVTNRTGSDLSVTAELMDAQNGSASLGSMPTTLRPGANELAFRAATKTARVRLRLTAAGAPLADQTVALESRDPVTMLGRLDYYMNEPEALFRVTANLPELDGMTASVTVAGRTVDVPAAPSFTVAVPLADVPDGEHAAVVTLRRDGRQVASTAALLVKRPYRPGATQVNRFSRSLIHDGEAILPVAPFFVFAKHQSIDYVVGAVDLVDRHGFRYLHLLVDNRAVDQAVAALERAREKGIRVLLWTKYYELTDAEGDRLRERLDFPNVISQMVLDEPELGMPSDDARDYLRRMRARYPYHPVHMNNTVLGIPNRYANLETDILMLDDYLTNNENRTVASVVQGADIMRETGAADGTPCFYFVVCGNFPLHYREPSYGEQIAQSYGCLAAGCTGLSYFYGLPATPGNWRAYLQLNREILALTEVLLSETAVGPATGSADPATLRSLTRRHGDFVYVVAANIDDRPLARVSFTLPAELRYAESAAVMFEDREIPVGAGRFADDFAGYSRHVYKVRIR